MPDSETMTARVHQRHEKLGNKHVSIKMGEVFFKQENDPAGKGFVA